MRCNSCGIGDLPENWQNSLYPVGSPNSNYQDAVSGADQVGAGTLRFMRNLVAVGYPTLPRAGALDQLPGVIPSYIPPVYFPPPPQPAPSTVVSVQSTAPPPILIATVSAPTSAPAPVISTPLPPPIVQTPVYTPAPKAPSSPRKQLDGIEDSDRTAFPFDNQGMSTTGNLWWYLGAPVLNRGVPIWSNDATEFLRHAMVESNWDQVELWLAWAIANGYPQSELHRLDFGRYKYSQGPTGNRIYYPFSSADYESFFKRFLKYASAVPVDRDCMNSRLALVRKAVASNPRNQFTLTLSECPLSLGWTAAILKAVAVIAIPAAIATAATAFAALSATATAGTAAATGATVGTTAGTAAGVSTALAPVIETVVVTASSAAIPTAALVASSVGAALGTGAIVSSAAPAPISSTPISTTPISAAPIETVVTQASALPAVGVTAPAVALSVPAAVVPLASAPAPFSPQQAPPQQPPSQSQPQIEEVVTQASRIEAPTIGQAIGTGAVALTSAAPALMSPTIETVTVENSRIPESEPTLSPELAAQVLESVATVTLPEAMLTEPEAPEYDESTIKDSLQKIAKQLGTDYLKQQLQSLLESWLNRSVTPQELEQYNEWLDAMTPQVYTGVPASRVTSNSSANGLIIVAAILAGLYLTSED